MNNGIPITETFITFIMSFSLLINWAVPGTIDNRLIPRLKHRYDVIYVLDLALNSARAIGCDIGHVKSIEFHDRSEDFKLGLIWQIIKVSLCALIVECDFFLLLNSIAL